LQEFPAAPAAAGALVT